MSGKSGKNFNTLVKIVKAICSIQFKKKHEKDLDLHPTSSSSPPPPSYTQSKNSFIKKCKLNSYDDYDYNIRRSFFEIKK